MDSGGFCPLSKLETLLLATDGSLYSEGATREAINFAKKCSSTLYVLRVLETTPEYETIGSSVYDKEEAEAIGHLAEIRMRALREGLRCETIFHRGSNPHEFIVDEAWGKQVDMIILGRRGLKGLSKLLMGEVASKVIAHAGCKVMVVPKAAKIDFRNILIATDGSEHSIAAASEAVGIAKRCGTGLVALSSVRANNELEQAKKNVGEVVELARKEGVSADPVTPVGKSYDVIVETAAGRGVDLIVMGAYGKTGLKKLLMGSSTEKVIGKAGCAILVVKAKGESVP